MVGKMTEFPRIEILIGNRFTWGGIELTIESILQRTRYPNYEIIVVDNSQAPYVTECQPPRDLTGCDDDGSRIEYLRKQQRKGSIRLIEVTERRVDYGHGKNIEVGLNHCTAPFAMLLSSGNEVIHPNWLLAFFWKIKDKWHDLGIAIQTEGLNHFDNCWIAPRYLPNWMMLNMTLYGDFRGPDDWSLKRVPFPEYKYRNIFDGQDSPKHPSTAPVNVFLDTGWRLYERLNFEDNPGGLRMVELRPRDRRFHFNFLGGLDRNAHRTSFPFVVQRRKEIEERLWILRGQ